jgi:hypothetical protein
MEDAEPLIEHVERARTALLASVSGLSDSQAASRPPAGGWSINEVLEHLYLAEISGVSKIWAALDALKAGSGWTGERPNRGKPIEAIVAATWKEREIAPPIAQPHIGGPLAFWLSATRSLRPVLAELGVHMRNVDLEQVVFPHFLSGPLDGRQRLEFLRFHIERHAAQVERVRGSAGFPS